MWIGLEDTVGRNKHTDYKWVKDNSKTTFSNWNEGEPDDWGGNERCVAISGILQSKPLGKWHDSMCSNNYTAACETEVYNCVFFYHPCKL